MKYQFRSLVFLVDRVGTNDLWLMLENEFWTSLVLQSSGPMQLAYLNRLFDFTAKHFEDGSFVLR